MRFGFLSFRSDSPRKGCCADFTGLTMRNNRTILKLEWKSTREDRRGELNDRKRPRKGQSYRSSQFGRRRGSGDVRRRNHRHSARHNGGSIHSGVDNVRYARQRLVAQGLGLWLSAGMGLAPRTVLALGLVLSVTRRPSEKSLPERHPALRRVCFFPPFRFPRYRLSCAPGVGPALRAR